MAEQRSLTLLKQIVLGVVFGAVALGLLLFLFPPTRDLFERWVHARDRDASSKPSVAKAVEVIEDAQGHKGLRISPAAMANLEVQPTEVKLALEARPLPPQIGHVNFDNDHLFTIRPRFPGELV